MKKIFETVAKEVQKQVDPDIFPEITVDLSQLKLNSDEKNFWWMTRLPKWLYKRIFNT